MLNGGGGGILNDRDFVLQKLEGSIADVDLVNLDKVPTRDLTTGDKSGDSEANCDSSEGITDRACKMELA